MAQSKPVKTWKEIEEDNPEQRRCYLESKLRGRESIYRYSDIKFGDHLVTKGGINGVLEYEHHFLCTGFDHKDEPMIIHYYQSWSKARIWPMVLTSFFGSGSFLTMKGEIQEVSLRDYIKEEDLQGKEVKRVVWPDELRRYSAEEVVRRARKRKGPKGELKYDLTKNNCESFVMWCLCDLNTSLQVTPRRKTVFEMLSAAFWKMTGQIPKICCDVADDVFQATERFLVKCDALPDFLKDTALSHLSNFGDGVGVFIIVLYEAACLLIEVKDMYEDWNGTRRLIKSTEELHTKMGDRVLLFLFRPGGSIACMFFGQLLWPCWPTLGGLVGAVLGAIIGEQILAKIFSATNATALAPSLRSMIDEIKVKLPTIPFFEGFCI